MAAAGGLRIALFTQQVSHYHAARFRAARAAIPDMRVISLVNSADFREFLSDDAAARDAVRVFQGQDEYEDAVRSGALWRRIHAELAAFSPDVVVVAGWSFPESLAAISWARGAGARAVVMSESQSHDAPRSSLRETLKRRIVSACDAALVGAEAHAQYAVTLGIPREAVVLGYDAVDNAHFSAGADAARARGEAVRSARGLPARYLLACGRFMAKKNFDGLIRAFARAIGGNDTGHHLVILGDGAERPGLEEEIRRSGLGPRIHLPGFRGYDVLPDFYGLADGFAHVATSEQWGLVVNEAAAAGLPLVVSRPTGASALVQDGHNGFLVDPADEAELARALGRVMAAGRETREEMGARSRRIVSEWGPERFARGLRQACEYALKAPARSLGIADRLLLRAMARVWISTVT